MIMEETNKGIQFMQEGKFEEAASCFNKVIEKAPEDPIGYINFGNLLLHMNDAERAERFFAKAITLDETAGTAYYGLGNLYFEQDDLQKAQTYYQKAIDSGLEEADVYFMLGLTLQQQEHDKFSLIYFQRAKELKPKDEAILFQYGLALAQTNQVVLAKEMFESVLELDQFHSDAHYNLAVAYLFEEKAEEALVHLAKAIEIQPDHLLAADAKATVEALIEESNQ